MIFHVDIRDLPGYPKKLSAARCQAGIEAIRKTMKERGRVLLQQENRATQPRIPFDRGTFENSGRAISIPFGARFYSTSPYAGVINRGRRPGTWSNIQALIGWVKRKGLVDNSAEAVSQWSRRKQSGGFMGFLATQKMSAKKTQRAYGDSAARSIAFAVAAAIKKRGLPAKHVLDRSFDRMIGECRQAFRAAISGRGSVGGIGR